MPDDAPQRSRHFPDEQALAAFGAAIAAQLERGEAVTLDGPLGAGKSTLARGLVQALAGADAEAPSPTFTLVQTYDTPRLMLAHLDLYRLARPEEAFELGLDEALDVGATVIEWARRLDPGALPPDRLEIALAPEAGLAGEGRRADWRGHGAWAAKAGEL